MTSQSGEQCLVSGSAGVSLEPCLSAIAAGDGREVMSFDKAVRAACVAGSSRAIFKNHNETSFVRFVLFASGLRIARVGDRPHGVTPKESLPRLFRPGWADSESCQWRVFDIVGWRDVSLNILLWRLAQRPAPCCARSGGGNLVSEACNASPEAGDGRSVFSMTPSGQVKMPRMGNFCLTIAGDGAVEVDAAPSADVSATSSSAQHIVKNAVDGDPQSFWASAHDPESAVDMQFDLGATEQIKSVEIEWEYPAQADISHASAMDR